MGNVIGNSEDFALMLVCVTLARDIECFQIKIERTPSFQLCSREESWPQSKEIRGRHHQRIESFSAERRIEGVVHRTNPKLVVPVMGRHELSSCVRRNGSIQGPFRHKERAIIGFDFVERIVRCHLLKEGCLSLSLAPHGITISVAMLSSAKPRR
ncbi:hypothetical protein ACFYE9_13360 [Rhizobium leguminosarum]|uniref:Uncharacterized protein n=1 Tax=Rhizobium leguminosarum TaxID=384 RepID=A0ACD5F7T5_RHILE|nr:hypothetical protein [Rhizobium leguminosarum]